MQKAENNKTKYVFVCGLHRSGTTVLARNIGKLENCTVFENTGAIMDEGQFLQDVYPPDDDYGGVGLFSFDERAHLTESSKLLTLENATRLRASWHAHWDKNKSICVEKTPGNLIMGRFLQKIFDDCYFIVIKRHPVPVSLATQKWSLTPMHHLFEHWLHCHKIFEEDRNHLKNLYELRYEDYIENPAKYMMEIAAFIGTTPSKRDSEKITDAHNKKYFDVWARLQERSILKGYYQSVAKTYGPRFAIHGYSLTESGHWVVGAGLNNRSNSSGVGLPYRCAANVQAFVWNRWRDVKETSKKLFPQFVVTKIKKIRRGEIAISK